MRDPPADPPIIDLIKTSIVAGRNQSAAPGAAECRFGLIDVVDDAAERRGRRQNSAASPPMEAR
jgi:hypothetical protein